MYDNKILVASLPAHTSHITQPLDVSVFAPLKKYFRRYLSEYQVEKGFHVGYDNLPSIIEKAWIIAMRKEKCS